MPRTLSADHPLASPAASAPTQDWVERELEMGMAEMEAGDVVPLEPVLDELRASIARMEAKSGLKRRG